MQSQSLLVSVGVALLLVGCAQETPTRATEPTPSRPSATPHAPRSGQSIVVYDEAQELRGYLHIPEGDGPFPAVVFHHGSEPHPPNFGGQAAFYLPHGFVVFAPHRRGHGLSSAATSYRSDLLTDPNADPEALVALLELQLEDAGAALRFVRLQPEVDAARVFVAGCSLGGIEALLSAERHVGVRAAVDFSGGAIVWRTNAPLRERMLRAANRASVPVLFLQAENDYDTTPSRELAAERERAGRPGRAQIFPAQGSTAREGHAFCGGGVNPPWGATVLAFVNEAFSADPMN